MAVRLISSVELKMLIKIYIIYCIIGVTTPQFTHYLVYFL